MATTSLASLSLVDDVKLTLECGPGEGRVFSIAAVDGSAVAEDTRGVAIVDGSVREAIDGTAASSLHVLVAFGASVAIVTVTGDSRREGSDGSDEEESNGLDHDEKGCLE